MKFKTNKTKLIAKIILLVLLVTSALSFVGCSNKNKIDVNKRFNIEDGTINFLCMRSVPRVFPQYIERVHGWSITHSGERFSVLDGKETYTRPFISYGVTLFPYGLGDGRNFYEKNIKPHITGKKYEYSMMIDADFYAFQGAIGEIRYEFDKFKLNGEEIEIYNNDELVGIVSVKTSLNMSEDFYRNILDQTLFVITVDKYSNIEYSSKTPSNTSTKTMPNLSTVELSYLSIRDIRNYSNEISLTTYESSLTGGIHYIGRVIEEYREVSSEVMLEFSVASLECNVKMDAEFYEYRAPMGKINYHFLYDDEKGDYIELRTQRGIVGRIYYSSDGNLTQEWLIDFLDENLVVIHIVK